MLSKEREIFENIYNKRLDKIDELSKKKWLWWLNVTFNNTCLEIDFIEFKDPVAFLGSIKKREISIKKYGINKKNLINI